MAKKRIDRKFDVETGIQTFTEVASNESIACDLHKLFADYDSFNELQKRVIGHAINAKCGDSAADPSEPAIPQITKTWDNLLAGTWAERASGEGAVRVTDLAQAIANVMTAAGKEVTEKDVAASMADWDDDKKKSYRADDRVKAQLEKIRDQRQRERTKDAAAKAKEATDLPELTL